MCGPILSIAGTGLQAVGAARGEEARRAQLDFQRQVSLVNQTIALQKSQRALDVGRSDRAAFATQNTLDLGTQIAQAAAGGGSVNDLDSSTSGLLADSAIQGTVGEQTINQNAGIMAAGFNLQAANLGRMAELQGRQINAINPGLAFATTFLGGAGRALS